MHLLSFLGDYDTTAVLLIVMQYRPSQETWNWDQAGFTLLGAGESTRSYSGIILNNECGAWVSHGKGSTFFKA